MGFFSRSEGAAPGTAQPKKLGKHEIDIDSDEVAEALRNYVPGSDEEKALVRKVDFILIPILWWMYILAYLDRGNIVGILQASTLTKAC